MRRHKKEGLEREVHVEQDKDRMNAKERKFSRYKNQGRRPGRVTKCEVTWTEGAREGSVRGTARQVGSKRSGYEVLCKRCKEREREMESGVKRRVVL